jgi:hypothetical protein
VETAVVITHRPTGISAQASERRSQAENLAVAWKRLRVELALGVREPWPKRARGLGALAIPHARREAERQRPGWPAASDCNVLADVRQSSVSDSL